MTTTTQIIQREFVIQKDFETLPAVTLGGAWSSFMNTYAVWPSGAGDSVTIIRTVELQKGYYYVTGAVDNSGSVLINGQKINLYNYDVGISRTTIGNNTRVYHKGGLMSIAINAVNTGGPRGVAVTISNEIKEAVNLGVGNEAHGPIYQTRVGNLVWSTRTTIPTIGRYTISLPFRANITAHAWGGGGGAGGDDSSSPHGGPGSPGLYNTTTFNVNKGDVVEVFVGDGGSGGGSISGPSPGGVGGRSRININANNALSFNGGRGGNSGPIGSGGAGGGGGGASGVLVNNSPVLVAGGGGGGGGAGDGGTAQGQITIGSINNNAIGKPPTDYRGENGQNKGSGENGGGGGGGGGGYPGGQGGATVSGDKSAAAGQCGGNFPISGATTGINSPYYKSGFGAGGPRAGGTGRGGRVVLFIEPIGLCAVKIAGSWKQINEAFVKVGGDWKDVSDIYVKIANSWEPVNSAGQDDIDFIPDETQYGRITRTYT